MSLRDFHLNFPIFKPEWYFTHILNVTHEHKPFMQSVAQTLLSSTEYRGINAWVSHLCSNARLLLISSHAQREFTLLLLPLISRKLRHTIPSLLPHPSLFAHTIYQALTFDAALAEGGFQLQGTSAAQRGSSEDQWHGVSEVILGNQKWFEAWLFGEKKCESSFFPYLSSLFIEVVVCSRRRTIS